MVECPSALEPVLRSAPPAKSSDANEWRRSWRRTFGRFASLAIRAKAVPKVLGFHGSPSRSKTSVSRSAQQASPTRIGEKVRMALVALYCSRY